jgi:uncharacterized protein (DUF697 family)
MFSMVTPLKNIQGDNLEPELKKIVDSIGSLDVLPWMLLVMFILQLVPAAVPLLLNTKWARWLTLILAALMAFMNIVDGAFHLIAFAEIAEGLATLVISGFAGAVASVLAIQWIRE